MRLPISLGGIISSERKAFTDVDFSTDKPTRDELSKDGIMFSRGGTQTYVDSSGVLKTATANEPAYGHSPNGSTCYGIQLEPSSTNKVRNTALTTHGSAGWQSSNNGAGLTFTGTNIVGPDGVADSGKRLQGAVTTANNFHHVHEGSIFTFSGHNNGYSASMYAKAGNVKFIGMLFSSSVKVGAAFHLDGDGSIVNSSNCVASIEAMPNGWYRIKCEDFSNIGFVGVFGFTISKTSGGVWDDSGSGSYYTRADFFSESGGTVTPNFMYGFGPQFENSSTVSSYIPNTTENSSGVTRVATVMNSTGSNMGKLSPKYLGTELVGNGGFSLQNYVNEPKNFLAGEWSKIATNFSADTSISDPLGGTNSYKGIPNDTNTQHRMDDTITIPKGAHTFSIYAKRFNVTGENYVTNGTFDVDANWTKQSGWSIGQSTSAAKDQSTGVAKCDGTQSLPSELYQSSILTSGESYKITFTVKNRTAGSVQVKAGTNASAFFSADGTYTVTLIANNHPFGFNASNDFIGEIDEVVVVEGNKIVNGTFDTTTAPWGVSSGGQTVELSGGGLRIATDGTLTYIAQSIPVVVGRKYRVTGNITVTSGSGSFSFLGQQFNYNSTQSFSEDLVATATTSSSNFMLKRTSGGSASDFIFDNITVTEINPEFNCVMLRREGEGAFFNLDTEEVIVPSTSYGNCNGKIENAGNGWYRCSITKMGIGSAINTFRVSITNSTTLLSDYRGNNRDGIYFAYAQIEETPYKEVGSELITNGTFDSNITGWTGSDFQWESHTKRLRRHQGNSNSAAVQNIAIEAGKTYRVSYDVEWYGGGNTTNLYINTGGGYITVGNHVKSGRVVDYFTAVTTQTMALQVYGISNFRGTFDNISVKEVEFGPSTWIDSGTTGETDSWALGNGWELVGKQLRRNRANASFAFVDNMDVDIGKTYRIELDVADDGDENLVAYSTGVTGTWGTNGINSANAGTQTAPDGTTTGATFEPTTATARHEVYMTASFVKGETYTASVSVKPAGSITHVSFSPFGESANVLNVNITDGSVNHTGGSLVAHSVVDQTNGWYRISISFVSNYTATSQMYISMGEAGLTTAVYSNVAGDGTKGIHLWGGQVCKGSVRKNYIGTVGVAHLGISGINYITFGGSYLVNTQSTTGRFSYDITATSTQKLGFYAGTNAKYSLDNVSVREAKPISNQVINGGLDQVTDSWGGTSSSGWWNITNPEQSFQAGENLVLRSEKFNGGSGGWGGNGTETSNTIIDPTTNGTETLLDLDFNSASASDIAGNQILGPSGSSSLGTIAFSEETSAPISGAKSIKLTVTQGTGTNGSYPRFYTTNNTAMSEASQVGSKYRLTFKTKLISGVVRINQIAFSDGGSAGNSFLKNANLDLSGTQTHTYEQTVTEVAGSAGQRDNIFWNVNGTHGSGVFLIDDIKVECLSVGDTLTSTATNQHTTTTVTIPTTGAYTYSVYLKRKTGTGDIRIGDFTDGTSVVNVTNDWQRFTRTSTLSAGAHTFTIRINTSGDEVYVWGAQVNSGTSAKSYQKTEGVVFPLDNDGKGVLDATVGNPDARQHIPVTIGQQYEIKVTMKNGSGGQGKFYMSDGENYSYAFGNFTATGSQANYSKLVTPTQNSLRLYCYNNGTGPCYYDNISVREIQPFNQNTFAIEGYRDGPHQPKNLVNNGNFHDDSGWIKSNTHWVVANGVCTYQDQAVSPLVRNDIELVQGRTYALSYRIVSGATPVIWIGNQAGNVNYTGDSYGTRSLGYNYHVFTRGSTQTTIAFYGNPSGSTFAIDNIALFEVDSSSVKPTFLEFSDGDSSDTLSLRATPHQEQLSVYDGSGAANISAGNVIKRLDKIKLAAAYRITDYAVSLNGANAVTNSLNAMPYIDQVEFGKGQNTDTAMKGYLSRFSHWGGRRLPNQTLKETTTLDGLLLDVYGATAKAAYSTRNLKAGSGNVIRVRRSNDNAEKDFTADQLTDGTLTTFTGSNNGFVSTWYDQSGNANHLTQATSTKQPKIVNSGSVIMLAERPTVLFDGTDDNLERGAFTGGATTHPNTYSIVLRQTTTSQSKYIFDAGVDNTPTSGRQIISVLANGTAEQWSGNSFVNTTAFVFNDRPNHLWAFYNGSNSLMDLNSSIDTSFQNPGTDGAIGSGGLTIGARMNDSNPYSGDISEFILWDSDIQSSRGKIKVDTNKHYTIYD